MIVGSLVEEGAEPPPETFAWLICGEVAVARTFTVSVMFVELVPGFNEAVRVQVSAEHDHPSPPIIETDTRPDGKMSVTVMVPAVAPAPRAFDTVRVYVAFVCPDVKFPVCVLVMLRFGTPAGMIVVESLAMAGGDPPPSATTWFTCGEGVPAATLTVTVIGG
jgi:hypothetical protein